MMGKLTSFSLFVSSGQVSFSFETPSSPNESHPFTASSPSSTPTKSRRYSIPSSWMAKESTADGADGETKKKRKASRGQLRLDFDRFYSPPPPALSFVLTHFLLCSSTACQSCQKGRPSWIERCRSVLFETDLLLPRCSLSRPAHLTCSFFIVLPNRDSL